MRKLLLALLSLGLGSVYAQVDTLGSIKDVKLDLIQLPSNAAFSVMGTNPSEILMPGSAPEFMLAVQNASNSFSQFPNNFGFAVTPFWWTHGRQLSFEDDFSSQNRIRAYRNLRLSAGVVSGSNDNPNLWRYGAGLQTSLLQGKVDSAKKANYQHQLLIMNKKQFQSKEQFLQGSAAYREMEKKLGELLDNYRKPGLTNEERAALDKRREKLQAEQLELMKKLNAEYDSGKPFSEADSTQLYKSFNNMSDRYGWKWDIGLAMAFDLLSNDLDSSSLYRLGGWSNFGYTFKGNERSRFSFLGAVRYYYYDQVSYELESGAVLINNLGLLDAGARMVWDASNISISLEGLYRYGLSSAFENTYEVNAMLNYRFSENRMVYFAVGNDFDDNSAGDPSKLRVFIGLNLGFGGEADVSY